MVDICTVNPALTALVIVFAILYASERIGRQLDAKAYAKRLDDMIERVHAKSLSEYKAYNTPVEPQAAQSVVPGMVSDYDLAYSDAYQIGNTPDVYFDAPLDTPDQYAESVARFNSLVNGEVCGEAAVNDEH